VSLLRLGYRGGTGDGALFLRHVAPLSFPRHETNRTHSDVDINMVALQRISSQANRCSFAGCITQPASQKANRSVVCLAPPSFSSDEVACWRVEAAAICQVTWDGMLSPLQLAAISIGAKGHLPPLQLAHALSHTPPPTQCVPPLRQLRWSA